MAAVELNPNVSADILTRLNVTWDAIQARRKARDIARRQPALVRIWDGDWEYIGTVRDAIEGSFQWKLNDTGAGHIQIPSDSWLAKKIMDHRGRNKKNIHVTMDKDGARWGGRLDKMSVSKKPDGQRVVDLEFLHDYEDLKHIYVWPNPYLPAAVQFPRAFTLLGPTAWALKTALFLNVRRLAGNRWALPDDPFDLSQWGAKYDPGSWSMQVAPSRSILEDSSPWTVVSSRMKNWHELAAPKLADAHLMVTTRRWLTGDPEPWPGATPRHGALIVDIVDKSGYWSEDGTATLGNIWTGMVRTVQTVTDKVDTTSTIIADPSDVDAYKRPDFLGTSPDAPYVIYRDGPLTGVTSSDYVWEPAKDVQVVTGGHSAYGVNEGISAAVKLVGNYLGGIFMLGNFSAGSILDTFLQPIYADTILAWMSIKSTRRANSLGWSHYFEHFADGADKAYTLSAVMAIRQGFWETRERVSHKVQVQDGAPWFIGDQGQGHFFLGDRIGSTIDGLPDGQLVVEQVTDLAYTFTRDNYGWAITCGDNKSQSSPLEAVMDKVRGALGAVHDLGVI